VVSATEKLEPPPTHKSGKKPKVVVLGTGWAATTFIKGLSVEEAQMYDITLVAPRNYFLYTPLLPSATMGSVEERSIVTPIRRLTAGKARFLEANCEYIDTAKKQLICGRAGTLRTRSDSHDRFPAEDVDGKVRFSLDYDILVYAVGATANDFGCPGVKEHAFFFKEISDARRVRERVSDAFEIAALPTTSPEERDRLVSFVVVGGGPTGVEVAADLADFINGEAASLYPTVHKHVKVTLINVGETLLSTYDRNISEASLEVFKKKRVEVMNGFRVTEVTPDKVKMKRSKDGEIVSIDYGCVVWAAGIKEQPITSQMKDSIIKQYDGTDLDIRSVQASGKGVVTDEWLHVRGSNGSIFALGDASTVMQDKTLPFAEKLFQLGDVDGSGELDKSELRDLFAQAYAEFPQLEEYARYLEEAVEKDTEDDPRLKPIIKVFGEATEREKRAWRQAYNLVRQRVGARTASKGSEKVATDIVDVDANANDKLDLEEFKMLLERVDMNLRPFPPTAQVAAQQGKYLARLFAEGWVDGEAKGLKTTTERTGPFTYFHKGSLAYLGGGEAGFDLPVIGSVTGPVAGVAWKVYETIAQMSWKNRALVGLDWVRSEVFGRDSSRL